MPRHKNPRYRPRKGDAPLHSGLGSGFGSAATPAVPPAVLNREPDPRPWIEKPLTRPQADMLRAAAAGTLRSHAGRVTIAGGYASVVTLRALRERELIASVGATLTEDGREAIAFHRLA